MSSVEEVEQRHADAVAAILARPGVVMLLGNADTGKTTLARRLLTAAVEAGHRPVHVDTDIGQSTVGPPTTVGLRQMTHVEALADPLAVDELYFVGDVSPRGHMLPLLAGTARLAASARRRAELVVIDTSGYVTGPGLLLKLHKLEVVAPAHVVGLDRAGELDPLLSAAERLVPATVHALPVHPAAGKVTTAERATRRREAFGRWLAPPLQRVPVARRHFAPPLPADADSAALHGRVAGVVDRTGCCSALGVLEHSDAGLRLALRPDAGRVAGVRLGALRIADWPAAR